jgi:hypothetical protein
MPPPTGWVPAERILTVALGDDDEQAVAERDATQAGNLWIQDALAGVAERGVEAGVDEREGGDLGKRGGRGKQERGAGKATKWEHGDEAA